MRDVRTAILPPKGHLILTLDPPIASTEKPILMTLNKTGIEMKQVNQMLVLVTNLTDQVAPILFAIGPQDFTIGSIDWLVGNIQKLLGGMQ